MKITKKITALFVAAFAALSLTACNAEQQTQSVYSPNSGTSSITQSSNSSENIHSENSSSSLSTNQSSSSSTVSSSSSSTSQSSSSSTVSSSSSSTNLSSSSSSSSSNSSSTSTNVPSSSSNPVSSVSSLSSTVPVIVPEPSENGKILVAYFSWGGRTEGIANNIIANTGADSYRIERATPYSSDYSTVAYGEAKDEADTNARPPLKNSLDSIAEYNTIVLCYPIWWHTAPMTVGTFLNKYDFSGVTIIPVSQSDSMSVSQYNESLEFVRENAKNAAVLDGVFSRNQSVIDEYLAENGVG